MHRLALALGLTLSQIQAIPVDELHAWQAFDSKHGLPDVAAQWQRALSLGVHAKQGTDLKQFMPLFAWNAPTGTDALLMRLRHGQV